MARQGKKGKTRLPASFDAVGDNPSRDEILAHTIRRAIRGIETIRQHWREADAVILDKYAPLGMETGGFEKLARHERALAAKAIDDYYLPMMSILPHLDTALRRDMVELGHIFDRAGGAHEFWNEETDLLIDRIKLLLGAKFDEVALRIEEADERERERVRSARRRAKKSKAKRKTSTKRPSMADDYGPGDRLVIVAEVAKVINKRPDVVLNKVRRAGWIPSGPPRQYSVPFRAVLAAFPRLAKRLTEWADKHYPV